LVVGRGGNDAFANNPLLKLKDQPRQ
jgi:hypothetical protein